MDEQQTNQDFWTHVLEFNGKTVTVQCTNYEEKAPFHYHVTDHKGKPLGSFDLDFVIGAVEDEDRADKYAQLEAEAKKLAGGK